MMVSIFSYVIDVYPLRSSAMEWFKLDPNSKKGSIIFRLVGVGVVILSTVLSILVPNIVDVFGTMSSIIGIILYWMLPLCCMWAIPKMAIQT